MRRVHCFKCGSDQIDDGSSRVFVILGVLVIIGGMIAAILSIASHSTNSEFGSVSPETTLAGFVICYGFMLIHQGTQRLARYTCRKCGTVFTPPKPRLIDNQKPLRS